MQNSIDHDLYYNHFTKSSRFYLIYQKDRSIVFSSHAITWLISILLKFTIACQLTSRNLKNEIFFINPTKISFLTHCKTQTFSLYHTDNFSDGLFWFRFDFNLCRQRLRYLQIDSNICELQVNSFSLTSTDRWGFLVSIEILVTGMPNF